MNRIAISAATACVTLMMAACEGSDGRTDPLRTGALIGLIGAAGGTAAGAIARGNERPTYYRPPPQPRYSAPRYQGYGYRNQLPPSRQSYGYSDRLPPITHQGGGWYR